MEFPIKADFFPQVRLTAEERHMYVNIGERSAMALRNSMQTLDWKKTKDQDGVTYAQAHCIEGSGSMASSPSVAETNKLSNSTPAMASACLMMSATAFAAGTVSEVLECLASPLTEDYRRAMRFLYGSRFVDGVCLHTVTGATPQSSSNNGSNSLKRSSQAFTTVKWAAFDDGKALNTAGSPAGTDYCFLEHSGIHRARSRSGDALENGTQNETFGFSVQESISREREVPSLAGVGLARGHFHRTGILVLPTDRADVVQVTSILQMRVTEGAALGVASDGNGAGAQALARRMRRRVGAVGRLDLFLERRRLNKLEHLPRTEWVTDAARKACAVCVKPFALRRRKHHCRHCGEVVCASCAPAREIDVDTTTDTVHVRICTACVVKARAGSQAPGGCNVFVYHLRRMDSVPSSSSSTNSTSEEPPLASNSVEIGPEHALELENEHEHEHEHNNPPRVTSLSSGSSSFSISSDSQMSARLTRAGYAGGAIRLYGCKELQLDESSSGSSSSYSLSEFDSFDSLVSLPASNQGAKDPSRSERRTSGQPALSPYGSEPRSTELSGDLLDRIRGMKADLSTLSTTFRHLANTDNTDSAKSSVATASSTPRCTTHPTKTETIRTGGNHSIHRARRSESRGGDGGMDVEYINNSEHFTLLCPETLQRRWRTRTSSHVRQDAGEKSHLSFSASNMSFVSTLSNSTMLDNDDGGAVTRQQQQQQREPQDLEHECFGERSESQMELLALCTQVEGLHRSLAAATTQLDSIRWRRASKQAQIPADPVTANHQATYSLLVEELHEIMGLPRPEREH